MFVPIQGSVYIRLVLQAEYQECRALACWETLPCIQAESVTFASLQVEEILSVGRQFIMSPGMVAIAVISCLEIS